MTENDIADMTAEEAWEIVKKFSLLPASGGFDNEKLKEIFGTCAQGKILKENTPQEAKAKIKAWEENKKIHVGDIVEYNSGDMRGIVTTVTEVYNNKKAIEVLNENLTIDILYAEEVEKTGETIDIEAFQKQIRGE